MVNKVFLIGNLGSDPETRYTQSGTAVATVSIATSEKYTDKDGNKQETTEWHRVIFWAKLAEVAGKFLKKGSKIFVMGKLQTRKWTDQGGVERYTTEIIGREMQMLGGRGSGRPEDPPTPEEPTGFSESESWDKPAGPAGTGEDVPF